MLIFLKLLRESYLFALQSIIVNKVRTLLSLFGITIGIFSVISVLTIFDSLEIAVKSSINSLGNNVLFVQKWPWVMNGSIEWWKIIKRPEVDMNELKEIKQRSSASDYSALMFGVNRTVKYKNNSIENTTVLAVSHDYYQVMPFDIEQGRYFTPVESQSGRNVAIIGADIAKELYQGMDPVGKTIKVFGAKMKVIGITKKEGDDMFGNTNDDRIIVPVNFARNYVNIQNVGATIVVRAKPLVTNDELRDELTGIMRSVRKLKPGVENNFAINETSVISQGFDQIFGVFSMVGWIVGGFSLLVGGFGIANIMFVSVKERTTQIGIQMALGAKRFFILLQFLFESVFLSLFGGVAGLVIIYGLISLSNSYDLIPFPLTLTFGNVIIGLSVSIAIGIVAGIIPSLSASKLDPVEAMRSTF